MSEVITKPKDFGIALKGLADTRMDNIIALNGGNKQKAEKFIADLSLLGMNRSLYDCGAISVFSVALKVAQIGLSIVPEKKQAYILPYKNKKGLEAQLQISYIGWQILAKRAGYSIDSELVYECDEFEFTVDENGKSFKFRANHDKREDNNRDWIEKNLVGAMVWSKDKDGVKKDFISAKKLKKLQGLSPAVKYKKYSPWDDWTEEMFKAKAIKYVASKLPTDDDRLSIAIAEDNKIYIQDTETPKPQIDLNKLLKDGGIGDDISNETSDEAIQTGEIVYETYQQGISQEK